MSYKTYIKKTGTGFLFAFQKRQTARTEFACYQATPPSITLKGTGHITLPPGCKATVYADGRTVLVTGPPKQEDYELKGEITAMTINATTSYRNPSGFAQEYYYFAERTKTSVFMIIVLASILVVVVLILVAVAVIYYKFGASPVRFLRRYRHTLLAIINGMIVPPPNATAPQSEGPQQPLIGQPPIMQPPIEEGVTYQFPPLYPNLGENARYKRGDADEVSLN